MFSVNPEKEQNSMVLREGHIIATRNHGHYLLLYKKERFFIFDVLHLEDLRTGQGQKINNITLTREQARPGDMITLVHHYAKDGYSKKEEAEVIDILDWGDYSLTLTY